MQTQLQKSWYLVQFKPNCHQLATRNLRRQGFETFLPLQEITKRKPSKFTTQLRPLFPGYMFVSFNLTQDPSQVSWQKINSTMGVSRLVSSNGRPRPVPLELITNLMLRCDKSGKLSPATLFKQGEYVQFLNGPFANFIAKVEKTDALQRVWVLLDAMGQITRVQAKPGQLITGS